MTKQVTPWLLAGAIAFALAIPWLRSGFALSLLSQMGIAVLFALSYNMLFGQTGMLSFGHAVYFGLGGFATIHMLRLSVFPIELMPLAGGLSGLFFAILFGTFSTNRGGVPFSMISLGVAEMVLTAAHIIRPVFGGEEGISADRTAGGSLFGFDYGSQLAMLFLILAWLAVCTLLMWMQTKTLLGRLANAVRDNAERVEFVGFTPKMIRHLQFAHAGCFAGIAGALSAMNYESATVEILSMGASANVLLSTYIGGSTFFAGPMLGSAVVTAMQLLLSKATDVWQLYFGLLFVLVVSFAPRGLAGIVDTQVQAWRKHGRKILLPSALIVAAFFGALIGLVLLIEVNWHFRSYPDKLMTWFGLAIDTRTGVVWVVAVALLLVGTGLMRSGLLWWQVRASGDRS
ncbi:MAG: branched-chain amino acid ABC transporter permease [Rhodoferax sp.]|nr:branched-chain amino acid ABC transporter permease [Rhodoferax sp.]MCF8210429.1 branched-chain amino acid ABC transporter permease [Rhodoferax sp.]